jgi:Matrixin/CARDB
MKEATMRNWHAFFFGGLLITVGCSEPALAAIWKTCSGDKIQWDSEPTMRAHFSEDSPEGGALQYTIDRWNDNPTVFDFHVRFDEGGVSLHNDQNEIWFSSTDDIVGGTLGVSFTEDDCGDWEPGDGNSEIEVSDVVFNADSSWTYGTTTYIMTAYGGTAFSLRTVALHELGHSLGLQHEDDEYNMMGDAIRHINANGDFAKPYPGEDACFGARALYTDAPGKEDVGVVHWKWVGRKVVEGQLPYSLHGRTEVFSEDNFAAVLPSVAVEGQPHYLVDAGQEVWAQWSYENNGSSDQPAVEVGYYLSEGSFINTFDERLGGRTISLNRNDVYTKRHRVVLPADLVDGCDYWLGAIVDEDDEIDEVNEDNNATYIGIRVNGQPPPDPDDCLRR